MRKTDDGKTYLTPAEAMELIAEGDYVHTFVNPIGSVMVGADHNRESLKAEFERYKDSIEIGGEKSRAMKHAIVIVKGGGSNLFVEHNPEKLDKIELIDNAGREIENNTVQE